MNSLIDMPPMLKDGNNADLVAMRNYLIRLAQSLTAVENAPGTSGTYVTTAQGKQIFTPGSGGSSGGGVSQRTIEDIRANARKLQALIIKTANDLGADIASGDSYVLSYTGAQDNGLDAVMKSAYVAKSEFGTFTEEIDRRIENTAKDTVESYGYQSLIESAQETADGAAELIMNYSTVIDGQIRRGIVLDPDTGDYVTGIAISQNLQFTGQEITKDDGNTYYYLSSGQTFGLYTATGWQFWIDGTKRGWYSSVDGALHISKLYIENSIQFGATAIIYIESSGRFGIRHLGGST